MINLKRMFFMNICCNGVFIAVLQINPLPSSFVPQYFFDIVKKEKAKPFVLHQESKMNHNDLSRIVNNVNAISCILGLSTNEIIELNVEQRINRLKEYVHGAVYGCVIKSTNKKELFEIYTTMKNELKMKNINLRNVPVLDYKIIQHLDNQKIIEIGSSSIDYDFKEFIFLNVPRHCTKHMCDLIS